MVQQSADNTIKAALVDHFHHQHSVAFTTKFCDQSSWVWASGVFLRPFSVAILHGYYPSIADYSKGLEICSQAQLPLPPHPLFCAAKSATSGRGMITATPQIALNKMSA